MEVLPATIMVGSLGTPLLALGKCLRMFRSKTCPEFRTIGIAVLYLTCPLVFAAAYVWVGSVPVDSSLSMSEKFMLRHAYVVAAEYFILFIVQILVNVEVTEAGES